MIMTKAAVLIEPGEPLIVEEVVVDKPGPHEVRIRTAACGLCHSDLHFIDGAYPHPLPSIPGPEAAGIVAAVGSEVRTVRCEWRGGGKEWGSECRSGRLACH